MPLLNLNSEKKFVKVDDLTSRNVIEWNSKDESGQGKGNFIDSLLQNPAFRYEEFLHT